MDDSNYLENRPDLVSGVGREHDAGEAQARQHFGQQSLRQIHRVCDPDDDQTRMAHSRPLEQVVQHLQQDVGECSMTNELYVCHYYRKELFDNMKSTRL